MRSDLQKAVDQVRQLMDATGVTDAQLLSRFIAERDEAAFSALVRRHGPMVLGVCRRILGNHHDTDERSRQRFSYWFNERRRSSITRPSLHGCTLLRAEVRSRPGCETCAVSTGNDRWTICRNRRFRPPNHGTGSRFWTRS